MWESGRVCEPTPVMPRGLKFCSSLEYAFYLAVYRLELKMEMPQIKSSMEGSEWVG